MAAANKDLLWTHLNLDTADATSYLKSELNLSGYPSYFMDTFTTSKTAQSLTLALRKLGDRTGT